jgi:hypothetical protein
MLLYRWVLEVQNRKRPSRLEVAGQGHCHLVVVVGVVRQGEEQREEEEHNRSCRHIVVVLGGAPFDVAGSQFASLHVPGEQRAEGHHLELLHDPLGLLQGR